MHPWSLTFDDAKLEAQYTASAFRATYAPLAAFTAWLGVVWAMMAVINPSQFIGYAAASLSSLVWCGARLYLHRMDDQQRARHLFGRVVTLLLLVAWATTALWFRYYPPQPISAGALFLTAGLYFLVVIYLRHAALAFDHHLAFVATTIVGLIALPPCSKLGRPVETLIMVGTLLLGQVAGHTLESHRRKRHLHLHDMQQTKESFPCPYGTPIHPTHTLHILLHTPYTRDPRAPHH